MTGIIEGGWGFVAAVYLLTWGALLGYTAWVGRRLERLESTTEQGNDA